ncbi:HAD family hydrolase [Rhodococcus pyridinivorans]|uniref:HAD family hydrolase n=1 Tax=Rhodococcus pyridinivorans TaxID=103816 RepID=UPI003463FD6E
MTCGLSPLPTSREGCRPLTPVDLLFTAPELAELLRQALREGHWLDAYLLAAGATQLVDDAIRPDPAQLYRAAALLRRDDSMAVRLVGSITYAAAGTISAVMVGVHHRNLDRLRTSLRDLTFELARMIVDPTTRQPSLPPRLEPTLHALANRESDVVRVPSCFRSFDQHPDDMVELARRFHERPAAARRVCVVGVRTSGNYLAPLLGAALERRGTPEVSAVTYRPGRPWERSDAKILRSTAREGGTILVVDDPPVTGGSIADTARAVETLGIPRHRIVLVVALAEEMPPPALARWEGVYLPWNRWAVHRRLTRTALAATLREMLGPAYRVVASGPRRLPGDNRARVRARFSVTFITESSNCRREIIVEGAGLGFFGRHAVAVAAPLQNHFPHVYGVSEGLLYRDWVSGPEISEDFSELAESIAKYVADRGRALRVLRDPTRSLRDRGTSAAAAARVLSGMFGRFDLFGQYLLLDRVTRGLLRTDTPSIPDGQTQLQYWRRSSRSGAVRKVQFHQSSFSNLEITCYDSVYDLAGAAVESPAHEFEELLRTCYTERTGEAIDPERWLLYKLTALWRLCRTGDMNRDDIEFRSASAVHEYLSTVIPPIDHDVRVLGGPLCAVDLDGVLETSPLGYPCTTPLGALSVRALAAHGYRPVPVTGRCLRDAIDRCRRFGLVGAVAEYGAVVYDARTETWTDLRTTGAVAALERVRAHIAGLDDIRTDPRFRFVVRARSRSGPLPDVVAAGVVAAADGRVRAVQGQSQTDFVPQEVDKSSGLSWLAHRLDEEIALAVGDSGEDLGVLAMAGLSRAPRNADEMVHRSGVTITPHAYQAGFADACSDLLGHRPGGCPHCAPLALSARSRLLCSVLALREDGIQGLPLRTMRLAAAFARPSWKARIRRDSFG